MTPQDLPITQKTYDLIQWFIPRLNKFPRSHKFVLGKRMQTALYELLEGLIRARYAREKAPLIESLNADLEVLRYQTRLCREFELLDDRRYEQICRLLNEIGCALGGWLKQQRVRA